MKRSVSKGVEGEHGEGQGDKAVDVTSKRPVSEFLSRCMFVCALV